MKNKLNKEFDFSNLSVSKTPLYALLTLTAVVLAVSCLGAFILPGSENYIRHAILHFGNTVYRLSYNSMDHYIMLGFGFIIGIYQFIFLHNKDYARAVLVKGEKRYKLFKEKVLLPLVTLVVITLVIKAVAFFENLNVLGFSSALLSNFIAHTLIVIVHAVFGFTAGAVSTILSGTIFEAIFGGIAVIALPKAILRIADVAASRFLYGYASFYGTCDEIATFIDPTRQIFETTPDYSYIYRDNATTPVNSIIHSVVWLVISFVIIFFLKKYFCNNYKFEKIGFTNANKLLTTIICFSASVLVAYYAVSFCTDYIVSYYEIIIPFIESAISNWDTFSTYNTSVLYIAFFVVALLLSLICNLIITRKVKDIKIKLPSLLSVIVVFLISVLVSATGCFGYAKRIPETDKIEKITVNAPFVIAPNEDEFIGYNFYSEVELRCVEPGIILTDKEDIELLKGLHLTAIEKSDKETNDGLKIEYQLKDGTTVRRNYFYLSEEASSATLKLWDTKEVKSNYKLMLLNKGDKSSESFDRFHSYYANYFDGISYCYLTAKDGIKTNIKNKLTADAFKELKNALYKDVTTISSEQWFKPETTYGMLHFNDTELNEDEDVLPCLAFNQQILFPVTSEMTNTVEFLKKYDLFRYLKNTETNFEAYLYDINASEYWKSRYQSFGIEAINDYNPYSDIGNVFYDVPDMINKNAPLTHATMFTTELSNYSGIEYSIGNNLQEAVDSGYAIKLSENNAKEYFEKSHFKYYSGIGGSLLLVYYPERGTTQTFIVP